jgi:hypothetical protein
MKKNNHNFNDGRGEVPAYQWVNPDKSEGGWVAESVEISAEIKAELYIGKFAILSGYYKTTIRGGTIRGGTIRGGEIWGGEIWGGEIWGGEIRTNRDFIVFSCVGSRNDNLTVQFDSGEPLFTTGCKTRITLKEFESANKETHGGDKWGMEYKIILKCVNELWKIRKIEKQ